MIDSKATFKISYGLYVVTVNDGNRDSGCIINTCLQVTSSPLRIAICVNKDNYTQEVIEKAKVFNVSVLTQSAPFELFERFGFHSGRDTDKFAGFDGAAKSENGLPYIAGCTNAFFSAKVLYAIDCGTHTMFIADVTESQVLSDEPSVTYGYYFANIKPKPQTQKKKGFVCKICGYVYEGDELPPDFVCPVCKHGAADFEPIK